MRYTTTQIRLGPEQTPLCVKILIWLTAVSTLTTALLDNLFVHYFGLVPFSGYLGLSWAGIEHGYLWQLFTYFFISDSGGAGITFGLLVGLFFNLYLLWIFAPPIIERVGTYPFLRLYFGSGLFGGLGCLIVMALGLQQYVFTGLLPTLSTLFFVWAMLAPEAEIWLFFLISFKAKWLMAGLLGAIFLIDLSHGDLVSIANLFTALLFGYLYCIIAWDLKSPFEWARPFDERLSRATVWARHRLNNLPLRRKESSSKEKIIDISTGDILSDEELFMDNMLEKISKHGEQSLSWQERERMKKIAERKRQKK